MKIETVRVTPEKAKKWLARNHPKNRPVSWHNVQAFVNDMASGNWKLTHQAIAFDGEGFLIDGQHRLHAVINSNATVTMLVAVNEDASFHDPIDRGRPRSVAMLSGISNSLSAACKILAAFESGSVQATNRGGVPMTVSEAMQVIDHHGKYNDMIQNEPKMKAIVGGLRAACIWMMPIEPKKTLEFLAKVQNGEMIQKGDPPYAYRNWRDRTAGITSMEMALAALNCLRYSIQGLQLASVYTGEMGYRASCAKRRVLRVPNTPGANQVAGVSWAVGKNEDVT